MIKVPENPKDYTLIHNEVAKKTDQLRLCPFGKTYESLPNKLLVDIHQGSIMPDFSCKCKDLKKELKWLQLNNIYRS